MNNLRLVSEVDFKQLVEELVSEWNETYHDTYKGKITIEKELREGREAIYLYYDGGRLFCVSDKMGENKNYMEIIKILLYKGITFEVMKTIYDFS